MESAVNPSTDSVAKFPEIKMSSMNNFNNHSLTVKVLQKDGKYYLFFPAKAYDVIFRICVAISDSTTGPYIAQPEAIR